MARKLWPEQIAKLCHDAGFREKGLITAVAVALAESGGNQLAKHKNANGSVDRGLFQINSKAHAEVNDSAAFLPDMAAKAAFRISKQGRDWTPWAVYNNKSYLAQMPTATAAVKKIEPWTKPESFLGNVGSSLGNLGDALKGPAAVGKAVGGATADVVTAAPKVAESAWEAVQMLAKAGVWLADSHNWGRVAMVVVGGSALLMGASMLANTGQVGSTAQTAAGMTGTAVKAVNPLSKVSKLSKGK